MTNKVIMYDSPEAAQFVTVTGWATKDGRFFGDNEHLARYCGSTHKSCDKDESHPPHRTNGYCEECAAIKRFEKFNAMPVVEWDKETPLNLFDTDLYFYDEDQVSDYCIERDVDAAELSLVLCEPNRMHTICADDQWCDVFAEDVLLPSEVEDALNTLNAAIEEYGKAVSWSPCDKRVLLP